MLAHVVDLGDIVQLHEAVLVLVQLLVRLLDEGNPVVIELTLKNET